MLLLPVTSLAVADAPVDPDANAEAVAWFRQRTPVSPETWRQLAPAARRRAFAVSGATTLDVLTHVWRGIDAAVARGENFTAFKRAMGDSLRDAWAGTSPGRLAVIYRNNVQSAYAAGRWDQMTSPEILESRPVWRFDAILDSRTTPICTPLEGMQLRADDPFWKTHYPPLHHQCRSGVSTLTETQSARSGGTGLPPTGVRQPQTGWGGEPNVAEWSPDLTDAPAPLRAAHERWRANET